MPTRGFALVEKVPVAEELKYEYMAPTARFTCRFEQLEPSGVPPVPHLVPSNVVTPMQGAEFGNPAASKYKLTLDGLTVEPAL